MRWAKALYLSLLAGLVVIVASLLFLIFSISNQYGEDVREYRQNLIWFSAQLSGELNAFVRRLDDYLLGRDEDFLSVSRRFDIFWSRAANLEAGAIGRELRQVPGADALFENLQNALEEGDRLLALVRDGNREAAWEMRHNFLALEEPIEVFRSQIYAKRVEDIDLQRDALSASLRVMTALVFGLVVSIASAGALMFIDRNRMRRFQAELEERVAERTRELAQSNADLREANVRLSQFNNIASHDLKEPVRKIRVFSDLLFEGVKENNHETIRYAADVMRSAAERARGLISGLLEYSEASDKEITKSEVSLQALIGRVTESLSEQIRETGATVELEDGEVVLEADALLAEQLFQNLISNGLKYRREGVAPEIRISVDRDEAGRLATVHVRDNGIGFDMKHRQQVFEPFRRLHGRGEYGGTGMGLAICTTIAKRHGWTVGVSSEVGVGSDFYVDLNPQPVNASVAMAVGS